MFFREVARLRRTPWQQKRNALGIWTKVIMMQVVSTHMIPRGALLNVLLCSLFRAPALPAQEPLVRPLTVRVPIWRLDSAGLAQKAGRLIVIVRNVANPSQALRQAQVLLLSRIDESAPRSAINWTDTLGVVRLDSVAPGKPFVRVRALGYHPLLVPVEVTAGCTSYIEAYMSPQTCDIGPCNETPPRTTLTLCRPPDA